MYILLYNIDIRLNNICYICEDSDRNAFFCYIDHLKNMPKQEIPKTIPQEVQSDGEEEIPQIEMPKGGRNFESFK